MTKKISLALILFLSFQGLKADEGMWMLPLIKQLNIQKMQGMGCTLTADQIYSEQQTSLKDAVIVFGNGCTGVVVSKQGLVFTNHHCGYSSIQELSSMEHNYLRDGFAAKTLADEIPAPGLTVKFLVSITDVTDRVLGTLNDTMTIKERNRVQDSVMNAIQNEFGKENDYIVQVKPFYSGNEFYVFMLEEFKDIRFAFAPPSSIGKFGGDTDNWMWPRHTGDFSVFRVYADSTGKPADYSVNNIPYTPKKFAPVSLKGIKPDDYAMILGNPGSTSRYLTSYAIHNRMETTNRARIDVRGAKQAVWLSFMKNDEAIKLAYSSKFARSSNYWKNSIGMNKAILKLDVIGLKKQEEKAFSEWAAETPERQARYGNVISSMEQDYAKIFPTLHASGYLREALISGVEMPGIAFSIEKLIGQKLSVDSILQEARMIYKDYYPEVDEATFSVMLETYRQYVAPEYLPAVYKTIDKKYKGDYARYAADVFRRSAFSSFDKFEKKLKSGKINLRKDPALIFRKEVNKSLIGFSTSEYRKYRDRTTDEERLYEAGLKEINIAGNIDRYPDANFTMRLTYGKVGGYKPADAVTYDYYTTTDGILEKEIPGDMEFDVPTALKEKILAKDFGPYADQATGKMIVNFLSNNDITGGNSGSPIFNAGGELLGLAFDGNWEAMSGDIVFEPELQRTINVDVRYILFIMDKVSGAERLIKELEIKD